MTIWYGTDEPTWRERVARRLDRARDFFRAPTTLGYLVGAIGTLAFLLVARAATTPRAARAADGLYMVFLNFLGGDR